MVLNTYIWGDCTLFLNITMIILDKVFNFECIDGLVPHHAFIKLEDEDGNIVERGKHDELIAKKGRYFDLYTYQSRI